MSSSRSFLVLGARCAAILVGVACLMGQGCPSAADATGDAAGDAAGDATGNTGWTGDPYGTWSAGLKIVAVPESDNPNGLNEGDASVETWTFAQEGGQTILTIVSGSTAGQATGTMTTTGNSFQFVGESSAFDSLGIHMYITIDGVFTGPDNFEGTKRTDFYSITAVWLGIPSAIRRV